MQIYKYAVYKGFYILNVDKKQILIYKDDPALKELLNKATKIVEFKKGDRYTDFEDEDQEFGVSKLTKELEEKGVVKFIETSEYTDREQRYMAYE